MVMIKLKLQLGKRWRHQYHGTLRNSVMKGTLWKTNITIAKVLQRGFTRRVQCSGTIHHHYSSPRWGTICHTSPLERKLLFAPKSPVTFERGWGLEESINSSIPLPPSEPVCSEIHQTLLSCLRPFRIREKLTQKRTVKAKDSLCLHGEIINNTRDENTGE